MDKKNFDNILTHDDGLRRHVQEPQKQKSNCGSSPLKPLLSNITISTEP